MSRPALRNRRMRLIASLTLALLLVLAAAPPARADAAGPTDYQTEIVAIEPESPAFEVEIIGGDAFMRLEQLDAVEIIVLGYQGEPYLRFDPDGTVYENRRSPAVWLNEERYGTEETPDFADPDARPEWYVVAEGGSYAWHDHRSHWMQTQKPPGADPGDQILEAAVPLDVDGERVTITVASYLLASPSVFPPGVGAVLGAAAGYAVWRGGRSTTTLASLLAAGPAALVGMIAFRSVPAETGPSTLLWLLPTLAVGAALLWSLVRRRVATTVYLDGLMVAAGGVLVGWAVLRFDALRRALIPSDAPAAIDRLTIAAVLVIGAAVAVRGVYGLLRPARLLPAPELEAST